LHKGNRRNNTESAGAVVKREKKTGEVLVQGNLRRGTVILELPEGMSGRYEAEKLRTISESDSALQGNPEDVGKGC